MVRYFYAWIPLVLVGTIALLCLPWLGLFAVLAALLAVIAALGGLAWAILAAMYGLGRRALDGLEPRRSRSRHDAGPHVDIVPRATPAGSPSTTSRL